MKALEIVPLKNPVNAEVQIPGSLSYSIRALNLAAMTEGPVTIKNMLFSDDTEAMMNALQTLGIQLERNKSSVTVTGSIKDVINKEYTIDINISGRTARSILGLLCIVPGTKTVTCGEGFKKRPVGELVTGLRQLGAKIDYLENEDVLPVKIYPAKLQPGSVSMKGTISSQFFSSIMMIAPHIGEITINVEGEQTSKSFIDVTIETMQAFGAVVENNNYQSYTIPAGQQYSATEFTVEADAIAAGYFWGIAAITGSTVKVLHLPPDSKQGDTSFVDVLEKMGCSIEKNSGENWISVTGPEKLKAVSVNMNSMPDSAQTLAVISSFAEGISHITGLDNLRIKETDRIQAPENELKKMGISVSSTDTSMTIDGGLPHGVDIDTYGDHRMAMSFAVAGTKIPGIKINNPQVVSKSFPDFWEKLELLGVHSTS